MIFLRIHEEALGLALSLLQDGLINALRVDSRRSWLLHFLWLSCTVKLLMVNVVITALTFSVSSALDFYEKVTLVEQ